MSPIPADALTVVNWNVEWTTPRSSRFPRIQELIEAQSPHVVCLTEGQRSLYPRTGHVVTGEADFGYPNPKGERRKVLLWSRNPWSDVDTVGSPNIPPGRFVAATTQTPIGPVRFVGVCIPWRDAHVRTGRRDREAWEDHTTYLRELGPIIERQKRDVPIVVLGDFNQRVPRQRVPEHIFDELVEAFAALRLVTAGVREDIGRQLIDHVAVSAQLVAEDVRCWPKHDGGVRLSDHDGVAVTLRLVSPRPQNQP